MNIKAIANKQMMWYAAGATIPSLVSMIKTPVFTRHFSTEEFGEYGLISIGFQFVGMLLFSWIASCLWRYFPRFNKEGKLSVLYQHLMIIYMFSLLFLTGTTISWIALEADDMIRDLILFSALQLGVYNCSQLYLVALRLQGKARSFGVFQIMRAVFTLILSLWFVFVWDQSIVALISSIFYIDCLMLLIIVVMASPQKLLLVQKFDRSLMIELIRYGSLGFLLNISFLMLTYCDRYVIAAFFDVDVVGIYDQSYKIAQFAMVAMTTIYFNTVSKTLFTNLESSKEASAYMGKYAFPLIVWGLPIAGFSIVCSEELAHILLGPNFRQGYLVMAWVFATMFFSAINQFYELSMKFSDRRRKLGVLLLVTVLLNVVLNLLFIPLYGYKAAAVTTFVSYIFMTVIFHLWNSTLLIALKPDLGIISRMLTLMIAIGGVYFFMIKPSIHSNLYKLGIALLLGTMYLWVFRKFLRRPLPID